MQPRQVFARLVRLVRQMHGSELVLQIMQMCGDHRHLRDGGVRERACLVLETHAVGLPHHQVADVAPVDVGRDARRLTIQRQVGLPRVGPHLADHAVRVVSAVRKL